VKYAILLLFIAVGLGLRLNGLGTESLSEDELNKLQTVEEYRTNGLSGKNGEHPFLMKGLQFVSIAAADNINRSISPDRQISPEAALRFPIALFGSLITLLLFLLIAELFGPGVGLIAAGLRAVEPMAIGFDRIAKEDTLVLFFFLLCCLFFVKSQTAAERGRQNWYRYLLAGAVSFGGLMASKYYPHLLAMPAAYYDVFRKVPGKKWNLGKTRWLMFFLVMGVAFVILNPTIVLPDTWREMFKFSSESRIGHDSYEFMGALYSNRMSLWLRGVPWTFYYVFIAVKTTVLTLLLFLVGLPLAFRKEWGDGRFLLFFWSFMWFLPFSLLGGKFTRYFTLAEPIILILAAMAVYIMCRWIARKPGERNKPLTVILQTAVLLIVIGIPTVQSLSAGPNYRLFTNFFGGGISAAGSYFPHDEFYDTDTQEITGQMVKLAHAGAQVACETPTLFEYYAKSQGRDDLKFVSLSDPIAVAALQSGDIIVDVRGRRYRSNADYIRELENSNLRVVKTDVQGVTSASIYQLDGPALEAVRSLAAQSTNHN
jgi:hypothetical protein